MALSSFARDFTYTYEGQTLTYTILDEEARTCETKAGTFTSSGNKVSGSLIIPAVAKDGKTEYTVTSIGEHAFSYCDSMTSVIIPDSVTTIGYDAFGSCSRLTSVTFPNSVTSIGERAFDSCSCLTSVTFPNSVTSIGQLAFHSCNGLTSVTIPNSVTSIGESAFENCSGLTKAEFSSVESLCQMVFVDFYANPLFYAHHLFINGKEVKDVVIPNSVTSIGNYAFEYCSGLTSVTIPNSVTSIGWYAFFNCNGLTEVNTPSIESWLKISFQNEYSNPTRYAKNLLVNGKTIHRLSIPERTKRINSYAFYNCEPLIMVTFPSSIKSIGENAFSGCSGLKSVNIQNVDDWCRVEFCFPGSSNSNPIFYAESFTVGDSDEPVRHLDLDLGDSEIPPFAFLNAKNLETIRVEAGAIGNCAFQGCTNVTKLCLNVDALSENCFYDNSNIEAIYCMTETPPFALDNSFTKYEGVKLYVPKGCVSKYENAETCWWRFLNIYESDFADVDSIFKADYVNKESGVGMIAADKQEGTIDYTAPYEVYNLSGLRVANSVENLASGIYIVRQGNLVTKIAVK